MKYVIDTHIFLWLIFTPEKISPEKLKVLKNPENKVVITPISFWEISLKYNLGKLILENITPEKMPQIAKTMGIDIVPIDAECMASFHNLPRCKSHKDPFDRIIIWYCICNNFVLVSQDSHFNEYQPLGLKIL